MTPATQRADPAGLLPPSIDHGAPITHHP